MIGLGFILFVLGVMSTLYGSFLNNDIESQVNSFLGSGKVNSGDGFIYVGIALAIVGVLLIVYVFLKRAKASIDKGDEGAETEGTWTCPNCGNHTGFNFCEKCGTKKPIDAYKGTTQEPKTSVCASCGKPLSDNDKFCQNCGAENPNCNR